MNYSLLDLPDSGKNPSVYMDISLKEELLGRLRIKLFRDVFPAGVENFVKIAAGKTSMVTFKGNGRFRYKKITPRKFDGCKFYHMSHNNYIISGDIYNNNGTNAGTVYCDNPIPAAFGDYYYPHNTKGLVSLVPFRDDAGRLFYDSTFMIMLDNANSTNLLHELDADQIVIGQVCGGLEVLDKMNELIKPYAGRKYPNFIISKCDVIVQKNGLSRRSRPITITDNAKFINEPRNNYENDADGGYVDIDDNNYDYEIVTDIGTDIGTDPYAINTDYV